MMFYMIIICGFLLFVAIAEFFVLLKDRGRIAGLINRARNYKKEHGMYRFVRHTAGYVLRKVRGRLKRKKDTICRDDNHTCYIKAIEKKNYNIKFAILLSGGYGDYLLIANWLKYLEEKFVDDNVIIDIYYHLKYAFGIFVESENKKLYDINVFDNNMYDAVLSICSYPIYRKANMSILEKCSPKLYRYMKNLYNWYLENQYICDVHPKLDALMVQKTIIQGKKRLQQPDVYDMLGIDEEYKHKIPINEDEKQYLDSIGLANQKFILIHRGWDKSSNIFFNVKAWSLKSCVDLLPKIKSEFPDFKLVLFGQSKEQAPNSNGCDLDLIGKTTIEQVKVLLKHAAVLIDNEGGMVHLRHALHGGTSIVMFGATPIDLFGYNENINLKSNICSHPCEWVTSDWASKCIKTGIKETNPCMDAITTSDVINALRKVLGKKWG